MIPNNRYETVKAGDDWLERSEYLFNFAEVGNIRFERGTIEEKKDVLSYLGSNLFLKDRKLRVTKKNELLEMEGLAKEERAIRNRLEPLNLPLDKAKLRAEYTLSPTMLRLLNTIRTSIQEDKTSKFYYFGLKKFMEQGA